MIERDCLVSRDGNGEVCEMLFPLFSLLFLFFFFFESMERRVFTGKGIACGLHERWEYSWKEQFVRSIFNGYEVDEA